MQNLDIAIIIAVYLIAVLIIGYLRDLRKRRKIAIAKRIARKGIQVGQRYEIERQRMHYMAGEIRKGVIKNA